jgi:hypothetical protein
MATGFAAALFVSGAVADWNVVDDPLVTECSAALVESDW